MKFLYEYRTTKNELRHGEISSPDRDSVYAQLKAHGIHPSRVSEAPGFFNKLFGKGKRWLAIAALGAIVAYVFFQRLAVDAFAVSPLPRHFIDISNINLDEFFSDQTDRFLAEFAIPGRLPAPVPAPESLDVKSPVKIGANDPPGVRELKQVVAGMKADARKHLAGDDGPARFIAWLEERQRMEATYRKDFENRVKSGYLQREVANEMFEAMGLEPL